MTTSRSTARLRATLALACSVAACSSDDEDGGRTPRTDVSPSLPAEVALPIVFVHGFAGSAQQYQSQAMRFVANGYDPERIATYEHDGQGLDVAAYAEGVDPVVDGARTEFESDKVFLVGHSRGTRVSDIYLGNPARAAKVAKYISLDGAGCAAADAAGVPCLSLTQATFPGQKHVEVATSRESFVAQYEFLIGEAPEVSEIVPESDPVRISGRAINFPANTGRDGATLEVWEIDAATGARSARQPHASFSLGADGSWGPVSVDPEQHYEMLLTTPEGTTQHFYAQRYVRSSRLVRLLSGPRDAPSRANANLGEGHAMVIALRMREWTPDDVLEIETRSAAGDQPPVNAINPEVLGRARLPPIAIHIHDAAASPGNSTVEGLPWFIEQPFQTGVDVFMPAASPPNGTITVTNLPRGDRSKPQRLNVPNWPSSQHTIMVMFSDYAQD